MPLRSVHWQNRMPKAAAVTMPGNTARISQPDGPDGSVHAQTSRNAEQDAAFSFVCLGVGGGPFDDDCSCYVMKPADKPWHEGAIMVEGGSFLGSLRRCLQEPETLFYDAKFPSHVNADGRTEIFNSWITHVLISHGHLDHIYGLVLASAMNRVQRPVYGLQDTLDTILSVFDGRVWPRLASYDESDPMAFYHLRALPIDQPLALAQGVDVTTYPISHGPTRLSPGTASFHDEMLHAPSLPRPPCAKDESFCRTVSTAFLFKNHRRDLDVLFLGDVEPDLVSQGTCNSNLWQRVAPRAAQNKLKAVFLECSYTTEQPNHLLFGHLTPKFLYKELECLAKFVCRSRGQDESALENSLRGLKVVVIHIKGLILSVNPTYTCCTPVPKTTSLTANLPLPMPIYDLVSQELAALEKQGRLGVEFIVAKRGQRIGKSKLIYCLFILTSIFRMLNTYTVWMIPSH